MKILQLTKKFPFPLKDGESIAVTNLSKSLNALGCEITLLSMNTIKHYISPDSIPDSFDHYKAIHTVDLDNRVTAWGAIKNIFSNDSYHVSRFYFGAFKSKLIQLLRANNYDIIQLETLYLAPYIEIIRKYSEAKIVMRSHNVEFEIWNRVAANTRLLPKKIYLQYLAKKLKRFEIERLDKYDALVTVTKRDLEAYQKLGYAGRGTVLPISINSNEYISSDLNVDQPSLSFIGSLDWMPNLEGLKWFLHKVWPIVTEKNPGLKLHIAGRNTPESITSLASDSIIIEGEVEDAKSFINAHSIMIVPLLSGSGMRVKILEGMALSRVVISTSIGMEGIDARDKIEILKADSPEEFAARINWILVNAERQKQIAANAQMFIKTNFDRETNAKQLLEFLSL